MEGCLKIKEATSARQKELRNQVGDEGRICVHEKKVFAQ